MVDDGDALGDAFDFFHVVGGEENGDVFGLVHVADVVPDMVAGLGVEAERGFVEEEDVGVVEQTAGDFETAFHAAGVAFGEVVAAVPKLDDFQKLLNAGAAERAGDVVEDAVKFHVFESGQFVVDAGILEDDAEGLTDLVGLGERIEPVHGDFPGVGFEQGGEHFDGGGFAGAVGSEKAEYFPFLDGEGNIIDGLDFLKRLGQIFNGNNITHKDYCFTYLNEFKLQSFRVYCIIVCTDNRELFAGWVLAGLKVVDRLLWVCHKDAGLLRFFRSRSGGSGIGD